MYSSVLAHDGYTQAARSTLDARSMEYYVFARITRKLEAVLAAPDLDAFDTQKALIAALHENDHLWSQIRLDVSNPENLLPQNLKDQLFSLAKFVCKHSSVALTDAAALDDLIAINKTIMKGLQGPTTGETDARS
jgi:flagellar biosynthesis activator protein FlaF